MREIKVNVDMSLIGHSEGRGAKSTGRFKPTVQGFWISLVLTRRHLMLKVFRYLPVAWVPLASIDYVRSWATGEWIPRSRRRFRRLFSTHHWLTFPLAPSVHTAARFAIITRDKKRIVVNLTPVMHYKLRLAVNSARMKNPRR